MPFLFECTYKRCDSSNFTENLDYGFYENRNGNCTKCMEMCLNDEDCGSIECLDNSLLNVVKLNPTGGYCLWWRPNRCISKKEFTLQGNGIKKTCEKLSMLLVIEKISKL